MKMNSKFKKNESTLFLLVPLVLSAFIHLWNPIGFPAIHYDEDTHYLPRALIFMNGGGPEQDPNVYDHPFFGQIFLAGFFKVIGYPNLLLNLHDSNLIIIQFLYMIPRILMGLLAILDTFLVYKISGIYSNRKIAFTSAILFTVMPVTWLLRWVLLDNLLLPFLLSSILVAMYATKAAIINRTIHDVRMSKIQIILILLSGFLLGLAIFTKIPAFTIIPFFIFLIYSTTRNKWIVALWVAPVILIPLIWPVYALYTNGFDEWMQGVIWQSTGRIHKPLLDAIFRFFQIDPGLLVLGVAGLIYVTFKREYFILLWIFPFIIFSLIIEFVSFFHLIFIVPPICIAASRFLQDLGKLTKKHENAKVITMTAFIGITIFGIGSTTVLISISASTSYFEAISFTNKIIPQTLDHKFTEKVTVIGPPGYFYVPKYVYEKNGNYYKSWWDTDILSNNTTKILFIIPNGIMTERMSKDDTQGIKLQTIYKNTHRIATFGGNESSRLHITAYPFTSTKESPLSGKIEIRSNY